MSRDVSNFPVQVQLFRFLSFTYVESHRDYLTVNPQTWSVAKRFLMLNFAAHSFQNKLFSMNLLACSVFS